MSEKNQLPPSGPPLAAAQGLGQQSTARALQIDTETARVKAFWFHDLPVKLGLPPEFHPPRLPSFRCVCDQCGEEFRERRLTAHPDGIKLCTKCL